MVRRDLRSLVAFRTCDGLLSEYTLEDCILSNRGHCQFDHSGSADRQPDSLFLDLEIEWSYNNPFLLFQIKLSCSNFLSFFTKYTVSFYFLFFQSVIHLICYLYVIGIGQIVCDNIQDEIM